eukprot:CAMPEP_0197277656 /NCGR_PEP_ID=MMETSP1432-20130617/17396_1 /TAXON_ID=44447 /ORGANISM="Pseudo-nitzschia delicatissima, Strain UNC1205" /LENGTH=47 /DNA_ID= /DNA_START= /DNA_END= /DNA_ORIENTATION=
MRKTALSASWPSLGNTMSNATASASVSSLGGVFLLGPVSPSGAGAAG